MGSDDTPQVPPQTMRMPAEGDGGGGQDSDDKPRNTRNTRKEDGGVLISSSVYSVCSWSIRARFPVSSLHLVSRRLKVVLPAFRVAPEVHHRDDQNLIAPHLVEDPVRKTMGAAASGSRRKGSPRQGLRLDTFDRRFDLVQKAGAQAVLGRFVELGRLLELALCGRGKPSIHFLKSCRSSAKTASASRAGSKPLSKPSMRRSDSSAQAASRDLVCGGESESQSRSINLARSAGGRTRT